MDCNSVFPLSGQICMSAQTCTLHVVHSEYKVEHPEWEYQISSNSVSGQDRRISPSMMNEETNLKRKTT